jgi:putative hemolysin
MHAMTKGRYTVRFAQTDAEIAAAQALRHLAFRTRLGAREVDTKTDADPFDQICQHMLVHDEATGALAGGCRIRVFPTASAICDSYSAQFFDLSALTAFPGPILELGRVCLHPDQHDADILRAIWVMLTRVVDEHGVTLLFGCASFRGADVAQHRAALELLRARHLAPACWAPKPHHARSASIVPLPDITPDLRVSRAALPPLLRSYLSLGGWVSNHAVVDATLDTLLVFTGLEIATLPEARKRVLRISADG